MDNIYFHTCWLYSCNNEKTEDITTFANYQEYFNKQTIKEKG